MITVSEDISLKPYNTFGLDVKARYFTEVKSNRDLQELLKNNIYKNAIRLIIGGGSNILMVSDFNGLIIKNSIKGIKLITETDQHIYVNAGAGEVWHEFVQHCIEQNWAGLENLSLIPGCVGASPMQNIGAYGVEIKDVFDSLEAIDAQTGEYRKFSKEECEFGYRESVFKRKLKDKYIITSVTFKLSKTPNINTNYGAINDELKKMGVSNAGIREVSQAVINIRQSKLPDPKVTGNAGSFFKNPEVSAAKHNSLKHQFEHLVAYPLENGNYKLAAGWLIEQCGLKGIELQGAAVHDKQALVLVNKGYASGKSIYELSAHVLNTVKEKFGVELEREVNIIES
jgi:UDP-N-acetylmuramate dehydrogenase